MHMCLFKDLFYLKGRVREGVEDRELECGTVTQMSISQL